MLVRCDSCQRPFVRKDADGAGACPHCGAASNDGTPGTALPSESQALDGGTQVVVSEGSQKRPAGVSVLRNAIPPPPKSFDGGKPPWEQRGPWLWRFFATAFDVIARPTAFFTHLSREGARGNSIFSYFCLFVGNVGFSLWMMPLVRATGASITEQLASTTDAVPLDAAQRLDLVQKGAELARLEPQLWYSLLGAPLTAFVLVHLLAGIVHISARTFSTQHEDAPTFETTYRFVVYAQAPMLLAVLPVLCYGAPLWALFTTTIAVSRLHRLRLLGVIGGVLMPAFFVSQMWSVALGTLGAVVLPVDPPAEPVAAAAVPTPPAVAPDGG